MINSLVELAEWDHFVATTGWNGGAALHVDTGMNRLGLTIEEAAAIAARIQSENHGITLLMSHLACADRPEHPLNDQQIRQFREIRSLFRGISSSLANSSGIFLDASTYCDLVRPGVALYGGNPTPGKPNPMRPVVELKARILQVRNCRTRRDRRLWRHLDRAGATAASPSSRRAMPTASSAPPRIDRRQQPAARCSSPASAARSSAASPWT